MFFFNYPMEAFGEQIFFYMDYLQIPLIVIFIKILHSIWIAIENYSMINYNVNDPIIVQHWWVRRYIRLPERKSKEATMLELLFTLGPLVMISYIILHNTGLSVGDNTTLNISSQSDNAILKAQGNQWYWDYEFIIKNVTKTKTNASLNLDTKYQNLNLNFNKVIDNLITKTQFIKHPKVSNYIKEALNYIKISVIRNKIKINLHYMLYILKKFFSWTNINNSFNCFPIQAQKTFFWKIQDCIKLGLNSVTLLWKIINGDYLDYFDINFNSNVKASNTDYVKIILANNNTVNYKVKDMLSLYTLHELRELKLLEQHLKDISLIILNTKNINISLINILAQIFKKWLLIEHKIDNCILSQYHLNFLNFLPTTNSWLNLKWDSSKLNQNIWQHLIINLKKKYTLYQINNNINKLSLSYLYSKKKSNYLYATLINKNNLDYTIFLSKNNLQLPNIKAKKAFFFFNTVNKFNSFNLIGFKSHESKSLFCKFLINFKIIRPYITKINNININFTFIKKLILFNIFNKNKNCNLFYSYNIQTIFKEALLKVIIIKLKNPNLNMQLQYSLSIGFLDYIIESLNLDIPLTYTSKSITYYTIFSNPSYICSKIAEKIIEKNYYNNLLLINNQFKSNYMDNLLGKALISYKAIDFIYTKNLRPEIMWYKKKVFFKIINLYFKKFNNQLIANYLNSNVNMYKLFVTPKLNYMQKLWYTLHKPNFPKKFIYFFNTLQENYSLIKKKKFNLLKWGLPKFPTFFFNNYILSDNVSKKVKIKHILKLLFHTKNILPNPKNFAFNLTDFYLGYYFIPVGEFIEEINNLKNSTEKIQALPLNLKNIDNTNTWKRYHFEAYMLESNELENTNKRLMQTTTFVPFPEGVATKVLVTSSDVIHSWGVPSAGIKTDGTPGRLVEASLLIDNVGEIAGRCYELCGAYHGFMPIVIGCIPKELFFEASDFIFPKSN